MFPFQPLSRINDLPAGAIHGLTAGCQGSSRVQLDQWSQSGAFKMLYHHSAMSFRLDETQPAPGNSLVMKSRSSGHDLEPILRHGMADRPADNDSVRSHTLWLHLLQT